MELLFQLLQNPSRVILTKNHNWKVATERKRSILWFIRCIVRFPISYVQFWLRFEKPHLWRIANLSFLFDLTATSRIRISLRTIAAFEGCCTFLNKTHLAGCRMQLSLMLLALLRTHLSRMFVVFARLHFSGVDRLKINMKWWAWREYGRYVLHPVSFQFSQDYMYFFYPFIITTVSLPKLPFTIAHAVGFSVHHLPTVSLDALVNGTRFCLQVTINVNKLTRKTLYGKNKKACRGFRLFI